MACDCQPGKVLCKTAEGLWLAVGVAYQQATETGDWTVYDEARKAYERH